MMARARVLTEKGTALKEQQAAKNSRKQKPHNTQSGTLSLKKKVTKANNTRDDSSSSSEDDCRPQKRYRQPDPNEIVEIEDGDDSEQVEEVANDEGDDLELLAEGDNFELDVLEGGKGLDVRNEGPANGNESEIELLHSTVSHGFNFQR